MDICRLTLMLKRPMIQQVSRDHRYFKMAMDLVDERNLFSYVQTKSGSYFTKLRNYRQFFHRRVATPYKTYNSSFYNTFDSKVRFLQSWGSRKFVISFRPRLRRPSNLITVSIELEEQSSGPLATSLSSISRFAGSADALVQRERERERERERKQMGKFPNEPKILFTGFGSLLPARNLSPNRNRPGHPPAPLSHAAC